MNGQMLICFLLVFICTTVVADLEFEAHGIRYRTLVDCVRHDYDYWAPKCSELGDGWGPAVPNNEVERKNIGIGNKALRNTTNFWIGGSTNYPLNSGHLRYSDYRTDDNGTYRVIASSNGNITLLPSTKRRFAIMCQKDAPVLKFKVNFTKYQKLVDSVKHDYTYWAPKCSEIGKGWFPAIPRNDSEMKNIGRSHKGLGNTLPFWIGGSTDYPLNSSYFRYSGYRTDDSGFFRVYASNNGLLRPLNSTDRLFAILCQLGTMSELARYRIFEYDDSRYQYVDDQERQNFTYWETHCSGLGNRWALTVINTSAEFNNIGRGLAFLNVKPFNFLTIDGSTNVSISQYYEIFSYSEYIPGRSGIYAVVLLYHANNPLQMITGGYSTLSALCEKQE